MEFKVFKAFLCIEPVMILIEAQWNLKFTHVEIYSQVCTILIEAQWNLKNIP